MQSIYQIINQGQTDEEHEQKLKERINYHKIFRKWRLNNPTRLIKNNSKRLHIEQRYKSFIKEKDLVFIRGLADYVEAVKKSSNYSKAIEKIYEAEDNAYQQKCNTVLLREIGNSIWGSWFNLELIYFLQYEQCSISEIFGKLDPRNIPFERESYNADINRVHHYLMERFYESPDLCSNENKPVNYNFNSIGSPSGLLKIKGFEEIQFNKQIAQVLHFLYSNKSLNTYSDYKDYNKFIGAKCRQVNSNQFRLLINSINSRVCQATKGIFKKLIQKQENNSKARTANRYRMIEF